MATKGHAYMNLIESLTAPAAFAPLIAGSVFLAIGVTMLTHRIRLRASSNHTTGKVVAIEKYTSTHGTGSDRTSGTYYRPIVEYKLNDETRTVMGTSTNEIRHRLAENVPVLVKVSEDGTQVQDTVNDPIDNVVAIIMALVGLTALAVYIFAIGGSATATLVCAATAIGLGHIISSSMLNFKDTILKVEDAAPKTDSVLIETKPDYIKEVSSHAFWGGVITLIGLIGALWLMSIGYTGLPAEASQMLFNDTLQFWETLTSGKMPSAWEKPLILLGMGLFFFLATLRSMFYLRKKYGALIRL